MFIPRVRVTSQADFMQITRKAKPVIIETLDIGPCTTAWTSEYLKKKIGVDREVRSNHRTSIDSETDLSDRCARRQDGKHEFHHEELFLRS